MIRFGAHHEVTWGQLRRANPHSVGGILFRESERLVRMLKKEVVAQLPDHEIDWNDVVIELRLRYTTPEDTG